MCCLLQPLIDLIRAQSTEQFSCQKCVKCYQMTHAAQVNFESHVLTGQTD